MSSRLVPLLVAALALGACKKQTTQTVAIPTATVTRGDIAVRVQATGTVQPVDSVVIKSKAGGAITQLPVEVGSIVKAHDLLAQIDPRDVQNRFQQAVADDVVTYAALTRALRDQARKDTLFSRHVITAAEHDSTRSTVAQAQSDMINKRAALDLARQSLDDATIESPGTGTVITRPVTVGTIVTPATGAAQGTTLMTIANLSRVRMLVTIDEVEMGNVKVGQTAVVTVDAFPDRTFNGIIQKVEPQAVLSQGVTFFPVEIIIDNKDRLLMPGMNGEVTIKAADLSNVVQVPIDGTRPTDELAPVSRMFGIPIDTLMNNIRRDLVATDGATGIPGRYAVVQLPDGSYEMRLVKLGQTDLRVANVLSGLKEGDKVVLLGSVMMTRPTVSPKFAIGPNLRRGATNPAALPEKATSGPATQAGSTAKASRSTPSGQPKTP
jgi:HlyD family secretion protein